MATAAILDFQKFEILTVGSLKGASSRHHANFIKIGQTVAEIQQLNRFKNSCRPPFWICWAHIGTTHDVHLLVCIVVPNLVKIDAVGSITCTFQYFARLA